MMLPLFPMFSLFLQAVRAILNRSKPSEHFKSSAFIGQFEYKYEKEQGSATKIIRLYFVIQTFQPENAG
ncbi:hypothetical protein EON73_04160 [bacterium]|nr:MAG: hypothetical protein EON73_04160 [bacterium]